MATESERKARGPSALSELEHCRTENASLAGVFKLLGCKAWLHGIVEGMQSDAPNHYDLSASMQLSMLLLNKF